jgi:hypothetical protein
MKNTFFWVVTPCGYEKSRRFGETYCPSLGLNIKPGKKPAEAGAGCFLSGLFFYPEDGFNVPPKLRAFSELHCFATKKPVLFIVTSVRT